MAYKVVEHTQARWRAISTPHLVASSVPARRSTNAKLLERLIGITLTEPIEPTETEVG